VLAIVASRDSAKFFEALPWRNGNDPGWPAGCRRVAELVRRADAGAQTPSSDANSDAQQLTGVGAGDVAVRMP